MWLWFRIWTNILVDDGFVEKRYQSAELHTLFTPLSAVQQREIFTSN